MELSTLQKDMIAAMKARDKERKDAISSLVSAVKKAAIDGGCREDVPESLVDQVILKEQKSVKEQIDTCPEERQDLKAEYQFRYDVISEYAPKQMDIDEIRVYISNKFGNEFVSRNKSSVIKAAKADLKGRANENLIEQVTSELYDERCQMSKKGKDLNITEEQRKKCHAIIHTASVAAGGAGAAGAQLPVADNAVIVPAQITMIIALGKVFDLDITKSVASGIIKSAAASFIGRTASQVLIGWIPGVGNAINTATAAGITETIGWLSVKEFSEKSYKYQRMEETDNKDNTEDDVDRIQEEAEGNRDIKPDDPWENIEIK